MKKIVLYVLSFVLILTSAIIPLSVSADTTPTPIGYSASLVTTSAPTDAKSITTFTAGTSSGSYTIGTAAELVAFAQMVNGEYKANESDETPMAAQTFAGVTVYLTADIDMANVTGFKPIGYNENVANNVYTDIKMFMGTFDGLGNTIDNLSYTGTVVNSDVGFFGFVNKATLKNLILGSGCLFKAENASSRLGGIVARNGNSGETTFYNVCSKATIGNPDNSKECGSFAGGIIGLIRGSGVTITNCTNAGSVYGNTRAGGIAGYEWNKAAYVNCRNTGDVCLLSTVYNGRDRGVGGFVGVDANNNRNSKFENCVNNGDITGYVHVSAFSGVVKTNSFTNCYNYGKITNKATSNVYTGTFYAILQNDSDTAPTVTNSEDRYGLVEAETKAAMLQTLCQVANGTTTASEKTSIRLITSVDGLGYQAVGFKLQFKNAAGQTSAEEMYWTSTVYTSIKGGDTVVTDYKASDEFAVSSKYFATVTIENLPKSEFGGTLTVTAMVKDKNGDIQYGETYSSVVQELFQTPALESSLDVSGAAVGNVTNNVLCTVDVEVKTERKNSLTVL